MRLGEILSGAVVAAVEDAAVEDAAGIADFVSSLDNVTSSRIADPFLPGSFRGHCRHQQSSPRRVVGLRKSLDWRMLKKPKVGIEKKKPEVVAVVVEKVKTLEQAENFSIGRNSVVSIALAVLLRVSVFLPPFATALQESYPNQLRLNHTQEEAISLLVMMAVWNFAELAKLPRILDGKQHAVETLFLQEQEKALVQLSMEEERPCPGQ